MTREQAREKEIHDYMGGECTITRLIDILFADDSGIVALSEPSLQRMVNIYFYHYKRFNLWMSLPKTEITLCRHDPKNVLPDPNICLEDELEPNPELRMKKLKNVDIFKYRLKCHS